MKKENKRYQELLKIARDAIESRFYRREAYVSEEIRRKFSEKQACFVTLTEDGMLKGCIGSLCAKQELWKDVAENAVHAAFHDCRFVPVREKELDKIKIEISVLSAQKKLGKGAEVFDKIDRKMGLVLEKGSCRSTFLPQVWEKIPDKKKFLGELSIKAGLGKEDWKTAEISFYRVEEVREK